MPPRAQPKIFQILVKTHKLTVFLTFPNTTSLANVKEEVFGALTADVTGEVEIPSVSSLEDFVLAREPKEKGRATGRYEVLEDKQILKDVASNWEVLYIQFRSESGKLQPVEIVLPTLVDDYDDDYPAPAPEFPIDDAAMDFEEDSGPSTRSKRKAPPE